LLLIFFLIFILLMLLLGSVWQEPRKDVLPDR